MGYIKFKIPVWHKTFEGDTKQATIKVLKTDMAGELNYDTNLILHALSKRTMENRTHGFEYNFPICFD